MTRLARRALDGELERLQRRELLDCELSILRELPADARAAGRLQALGALLEAHRAIAVRVRAPETHRAKIIALPKRRVVRKSERRAR